MRSHRFFWPATHAHSSLRSLKNLSSGHSQIAQGKQRDQLSGVPGQSFVTNLGETELPFDNSKGMLHFGSHAGLHLLSLVQQVEEHLLVAETFPTRARNSRTVAGHWGIGGADALAENGSTLA